MTCTFCEAPLPYGARYCPMCGTATLPGSHKPRPDAPTPQTGKGDPVYGDLLVNEDQVRGASTSTTAIISLACGIAAWSILPFCAAILAVITGYQARREIEESGGALEGGALATVGLVLGYAQLLPIMLVVLLFLGVLLLGLAPAIF